jgi:hypothetical protein
VSSRALPLRELRRFVIRTVRDGRVRINDRLYAPDEEHTVYDGRLEGLTLAFGLYRGRPDMVCLWGTEEKYQAVNNDEAYAAACESEPERVDGAYPWMFWHEVTPS